MSARANRHELLGDDFLEEAERRAGHHGPAAGAMAISLLLVEVAHEADERGDQDLWSDLSAASDDLRLAVGLICSRPQRPCKALHFLKAAVLTVPELDELDAIDRARHLLEALCNGSVLELLNRQKARS